MAALPPLSTRLRLGARIAMVGDPRIPPPLSLRGGRAGTPRAWSGSSHGGSAMASLLDLGKKREGTGEEGRSLVRRGWRPAAVGESAGQQGAAEDAGRRRGGGVARSKPGSRDRHKGARNG
ncbi:hypothetical protein TRIUR3_26791 [Triticum urartu]|uniref:Uncharacterized protein n=1 Tax=Triticum urartu TaxID=4572 RepID=M7YSL5_TRIUA|nr:hypothetical protein TRIUR3_26791 [Triticum urartu]